MIKADEDEAAASGRRRYWKKDEKRRVVAESLEEGASVARSRRWPKMINLRVSLEAYGTRT